MHGAVVTGPIWFSLEKDRPNSVKLKHQLWLQPVQCCSLAKAITLQSTTVKAGFSQSTDGACIVKDC